MNPVADEITSKHEPFERSPRFLGNETVANVKTADEINARKRTPWLQQELQQL